MTFSDLLIENS